MKSEVKSSIVMLRMMESTVPPSIFMNIFYVLSLYIVGKIIYIFCCCLL